ncbi:MAG: TPM domain-containing protein [Burkholderiaceae bacterium]
MNAWFRLFRHLWQASSSSRDAIPDRLAERLSGYIAASELRHTGEIRICIEGALPVSYLWRHARGTPIGTVVRQRAMTWFGRLRIWDTAGNNGVLIYLMMAEHAIELVADRGLNDRVGEHEWSGIVERLALHLGSQDFEGGITAALEEVSALLVKHFPASRGAGGPGNELPDVVVRV